MFKKTRKILEKRIDNLEREVAKLDDIKIQNGKILSLLNKQNQEAITQNIQLAEFKVFSQWGDDGIIQFLADYLDLEHKTFIEFGVESYKEANTRFLLINNNWSGLIMDGSTKYMDGVQNEEIYWQHGLTAVGAFITKENINSLIETNGFAGRTDLLHIDIDGNDYWVWDAISCIDPTIVIVEYNTTFGIEKPWTIPYQSDFYRGDAHYSNLYYGTSLLSLCDLAEEKGYYFIGSNLNGNNAYFVKKEKIKGIRPLTPTEGYVEGQFKESRNEQGKLTFLTGAKKLELIKGQQVYNTRTKQLEKI